MGDVDSGRWTSSIMNEEGIKKGCIVLCTTVNLVMMDGHNFGWKIMIMNEFHSLKWNKRIKFFFEIGWISSIMYEGSCVCFLVMVMQQLTIYSTFVVKKGMQVAIHRFK